MVENPIAKRLKALQIERGFNQDDVAEVIGASVRMVSNYFKGSHPLNAEQLRRIAQEYNTSLNWLILGIGEMDLTHSEKEEIDERLDAHDESIAALREEVRQISDTLRLIAKRLNPNPSKNEQK